MCTYPQEHKEYKTCFDFMDFNKVGNMEDIYTQTLRCQFLKFISTCVY